jgi:hypothetical protein
MKSTRLSNYGPGREPRARPIGRLGPARNSNGPARPEIQTIRAFSGLGRTRPGIHACMFCVAGNTDRSVCALPCLASTMRQRVLSPSSAACRCRGWIGTESTAPAHQKSRTIAPFARSAARRLCERMAQGRSADRSAWAGGSGSATTNGRHRS